MSKIRVLIVDDSAFMRKAIETMIKKDPAIEVVGMARNGVEALEMFDKLNPDVITLDIEMPQMDGLTALERIMKKKPTPVIMVSSLTTEGADSTMKALELGAVDFIPKGKSFATFGVMKIEDDLRNKIKHFAARKTSFRRPFMTSRPAAGTSAPAGTAAGAAAAKAGAPTKLAKKGMPKKFVLIGTSTGGPQSLQKVIPKLPGNIGVPILVVQHMPPNFTKSLATRLNSLSQLTVIEAQGKERLEPNVVYIAKGGYHMTVRKQGPSYFIETSPEPANVLHIPSVDVTAESVAKNMGRDAMGVIMTGMGADGSKGLRSLKNAGGLIVAQDEPSCVVYGMPRAVVEGGFADEIVNLDDIYERIVFHCK